MPATSLVTTTYQAAATPGGLLSCADRLDLRDLLYAPADRILA